VPDSAPPGSTLKVFKWVKTDKKQQFSDDEGGMDEPLAPLPDEPEVVEGDEEIDQEEPTQSVPPEAISRDVSEPVALKEEPPSKVSSPKPHPLSISFQPSLPNETTDDVLDDSLKGLGGDISATVDVSGALSPEGMADLDMSQLGPDGTAFEGAQDLTQMEQTDSLLGGNMMDDAMDADPFVTPST